MGLMVSLADLQIGSALDIGAQTSEAPKDADFGKLTSEAVGGRAVKSSAMVEQRDSGPPHLVTTMY